MSKAYSEDLRERVIKNYENGIPKNVIIIIFNICMVTLNRWIKEYKESGSIAPKVRTTYRKRKFSDDDLLSYVELNPSAILEDMAKHFSVKPSSVHVRLRKLGVTRKKNAFSMKKEMT